MAPKIENDAAARMHFMDRHVSDDYELTETVLGEGVSGHVSVAVSKAAGRKYAVKKMQLAGVEADKKEKMMTEVDVFLAMDHPHVARLVDVYESEDDLNLVMECLGGGDLCDKVTGQGKFPEEEAAFAVWQMLLAMQYVHNQGVVHRDLKLETSCMRAAIARI